MAAQVRMQRQDERRALLVRAIELFSIQLIEQRRRRHAAVLAEVRRLGKRPIDGQLDDAGVRAARGDLVWLVERLQAAVVEEALLDDQIERRCAEGPRWRAVADRPLAGGLREVLDGAIEQPFFFTGLEPRRKLVNPSVHADLVPAARED